MPYNISSCIPSLSGINGSDCIGDTRGIINTNFTNIANAVCNLSSAPITTSNTVTIQHSLAGRNLSSSVITGSISAAQLADSAVTNAKLSAQAVTTDKIAPDTVRYSQLASWQTLSASPTLSAEAVQPRLAKAWVTFRGTGTVAISSAFNVSSITDNGTGDYLVNFIQPMTNLGYAIAGTVEDTTPNDIGGILYISTATTRTLNSIQIKSTAVEGGIWSFDSSSVSLIVFDI